MYDLDLPILNSLDSALKRGSWLWCMVGVYLALPIFFYVVLPFFTYRGNASKRKAVSIIVLGDVGHSPRMCYHARSFSALGYDVNLCGYVETQPPAYVVDDMNIEIHEIRTIHNTMNLPYLAFALQKVGLQLVQLTKLLFGLRGSPYFMIQNPPSMPVLILLVAFIKLFSRDSQLIIDWHNLNYTILNLKFKNLNHPLVRFLYLYEKVLGRFAWLNLTVTKEMKKFLVSEFHLDPRKIIVLHDRPADQFKPLAETGLDKQAIIQEHSLFQGVECIKDYKILVTATSFTPDEDFEILLAALKKYEKDSASLPPIFLIVTGKGPMKQHFLSRVDELAFLKKIIIKSAWLSAQDYPVILSLADLAVSLHTSLSGIDLPMKIVDFFGVGVPVVTLDFPAIGELVNHNVNGLVTKHSKESSEAEEMCTLITKAMKHPELLSSLKEGAVEESKKRWNENWRASLTKIFDYTS